MLNTNSHMSTVIPKILIIDDDTVIRTSLRINLQKAGYDVDEAENGKIGLNKAKVFQPDVIILDVMMPVMNGNEVCQALRQDLKFLDVFIIMLSGKSNAEDKIHGLDIGADDYISKPYNPKELLARIRVGIRSLEAKRLAIIDSLTKLYNRYYFNIVINQEIARSKRYKIDLSILILDIDHFKKVNDTYGHAIGDIVLVEIADIIKENIRNTDTGVRWGGEEFIVILPSTDIEGSAIIAEKLRSKVETSSFSKAGKITVSIGYASFKNNEDDLFRRVDRALYKAKEAGRNKIVAG